MIKNLSTKLSYLTQTIILIVLSLFILFDSFYSLINAEAEAINYFLLIGTVLTLLAIWILFKEKHFFATYLIMFLMFFVERISLFVLWLFSFNLETMAFNSQPAIMTIIACILSIYLMLMIYSSLKTYGFKINKENFHFSQLILFFALLIFLEYNIYYFAFVFIIEFIAINYKKMASLCLMLGKAIIIPIRFIFAVFKSGFSSMLSTYLLLVLALYVIFLIIKTMHHYLTLT